MVSKPPVARPCELAVEQITGGCGGGNYCPLTNNTRGQMAVFIVKTFKLQ